MRRRLAIAAFSLACCDVQETSLSDCCYVAAHPSAVASDTGGTLMVVETAATPSRSLLIRTEPFAHYNFSTGTTGMASCVPVSFGGDVFQTFVRVETTPTQGAFLVADLVAAGPPWLFAASEPDLAGCSGLHLKTAAAPVPAGTAHSGAGGGAGEGGGGGGGGGGGAGGTGGSAGTGGSDGTGGSAGNAGAGGSGGNNAGEAGAGGSAVGGSGGAGGEQ